MDRPGNQPEKDLPATSEWQRLVPLWVEAEEIASRKRGLHPFTAAEKERILGGLEAAPADVSALQDAGFVTAPEADLLKQDFARLALTLRAFRPAEMEGATCYMGIFIHGRWEGAEDLSKRLTILEKLAASRACRPEVLSKMLATVAQALDVLRGKSRLPTMPTTERRTIKGWLRKVCAEGERLKEESLEARLEKVRGLIGGGTPELEKTVDWQIIADAWNSAVPLAQGGEVSAEQWEMVGGRLEAAGRAACQLAAEEVITQAEAHLLCSEAKRVEQAIHRVCEQRGVRLSWEELRRTQAKQWLWGSLYAPGAQTSLGRLSERLPALKWLAAKGRAHPAVLHKVLGPIREDIKALADDLQLETLEPEERAKAERTRRAAEAALAQIQKPPEATQ